MGAVGLQMTLSNRGFRLHLLAGSTLSVCVCMENAACACYARIRIIMYEITWMLLDLHKSKQNKSDPLHAFYY